MPNILPLPKPVGNGGTFGTPGPNPPPGVFPAAIDALNGFAAPPPVICGLKPTPNLDAVPVTPNPVGDVALGELALAGVVGVDAPVIPPFPAVFAPAFNAPSPPKLPPNPVCCCLFNAPNSDIPNDDEPTPPALVPGPIVLAPEVPVPTALEAVVAVGLVAPDELGIGGNDSISAAPKDEVGLNGFNPANPVICGFNGAVAPAPAPALVPTPLPTPVGNDVVAEIGFTFEPPAFVEPPNKESENVDPAVVAVGEVVVPPAALGLAFENANDDATLLISVPPGFNALLAKLNPPVFVFVAAPLTCGCCC